MESVPDSGPYHPVESTHAAECFGNRGEERVAYAVTGITDNGQPARFPTLRELSGNVERAAHVVATVD